VSTAKPVHRWLSFSSTAAAASSACRAPDCPIGAYTFQSNTRYNVVSQDFFTKDPGCGCIDPNKDTKLINGAAFPGCGSRPVGLLVAELQRLPLGAVGERAAQPAPPRPLRLRAPGEASVRVEMFNAFNPRDLADSIRRQPRADVDGRFHRAADRRFGFINVVNGTGGARTGRGVIRLEW
jgi:hypothetical protein